MTLQGKTYWIIGASQGLGAALARAMAAEGAKLILSARTEAALETLAAEVDATALPCDVSNLASVKEATRNLPAIDGLIYCVGLYEPMTSQDWNTETALKVADANYMGALRVLGETVPDMARAGRGHIILVGSLSGFAGLPGAIGYGSSKAALMHLAEDMQADLHNSGLRVQIVNPGFIRTRLTAKNTFDMPQIMTADMAAKHVLKAMKASRFSTSFPRPFSWLFTLARFIPRRVFLRLMGA